MYSKRKRSTIRESSPNIGVSSTSNQTSNHIIADEITRKMELLGISIGDKKLYKRYNGNNGFKLSDFLEQFEDEKETKTVKNILS